MPRGSKFVKLNWGVQIENETTPNTYIAPTKALCMERGKGSIGNPEYKKYTCDMMSATDGDVYDIVLDADSGKVKVETDTAMPLDLKTTFMNPLLLGAGMVQSTPAGTQARFMPVTASPNRISLLVTQLRRQYKVKGAIANFKIIMKAGDMVRVQTTFTGGLDGDANEKTPAQINFAIPRLVLVPQDILWVKGKCGLSINGSKDYWVSSAEFDLGLTFATSDDYCGKVTRVTGRQSKLMVTFKNTENNETPLSDLKNSTSYNVVINLQNSAGIDKARLTLPNATVSDDSPNDVDGFLETTRTFVAISTSGGAGDDNFTLDQLV